MSASAAVVRARSASRTHSIQYWLRWLVLVCVLPAWAITTWMIVAACLRERSMQEHNAIDMARALMQAVDRELASSVVGLQTLATSPFLASQDFANFRRQASEALANLAGSTIVVLDRDGRPVVDTSAPIGESLPRVGLSHGVSDVFQTARPKVTDLFVGPLDGQTRVAILVPVIAQGAVTDVLAMGLSPERLGEILYAEKLPENWISGIVDSTGTFVARTQNAKEFIGTKAPPPLLRKIAATPEGVTEGPTQDGTSIVLGFSRSTVSGWTVGIGIPSAELMAPLYQSLRLTISAAAVLLLLALLIAWLISSRIARSIHALNEPALSLAADVPIVAPALAIREVNEIGGALVKASLLLKERRAAREEAEHAERNLAVTRILSKLNDASLRVWQAKTLQEGLAEMLCATIDQLGADMGAVQLLDSGSLDSASLDSASKSLRLVAQRGFNQEFLDYFREIAAGPDSVFGRALRSGAIAVIEDTELDSSAARFDAIRRAAGYRAVVAAPLVNSLGQLMGMLSAHFCAPHRPSDAEMQWLELYRLRASDFIRRLATQEALRESEERLRLAVTASRMGMFDWDLRTDAFIWSDECYRLLGYQTGELQPSQTAWMARIHPDDREAAAAAETRARIERQEFTSEYRIVRRDGSVRWVLARGRFLYDAAGKPVRMIGLKQDITEARQQVETQRVLVGELQHRTRNLMAVVQSIAHQTLDSVGTLADFEDRFNRRLEALSRVQSLLSRADQEPITLGALVLMELEALCLESVGHRITFGGPEARLRKSAVEMLALAIHELLTNAIKYGALATETGRLSATWRIDGTPPDQRLVLEWIERGIAVSAADAKRSGYGRRLIEEALPYSLSAETTFDLRSDGLQCRISLPFTLREAGERSA